MDSSVGDNIPTLVMKFGGTSVGDATAIALTSEIILSTKRDWPGLVVVTSAMAGVTNLLLESANRAVQGDLEFINISVEQLADKHLTVATQLIADPSAVKKVESDIKNLIYQFSDLCRAIAVLGEATPRALDTIASLGERLSVRLLAGLLVHKGASAEPVDATELIITDNQFQSAHPMMEQTRTRSNLYLGRLLRDGAIPVVTGFIGATQEGVTTTLGRGGSDYTAAILGTVLAARDVWIWTDVNGVMTADPRSVPESRTIEQLSYREIAELAYYGAKVVHPKTIRPIIEAGIGLRVCNTFNPSHPGTRLVPESVNDIGTIKAVTAIRDLSLITVEGRGMLGVPGVAARTFGAVAATGTSVPLITQASSEQSICFAVPLDSTNRVINSLNHEFETELRRGDIDRVWTMDSVTIVTVVGAGMRNTPGIAGRIFSVLGDQNVNVIAIAQGSSEVSISLVIESNQTDIGVRAIHTLISG